MPLKTNIKKPYYLTWVIKKILPLTKTVCRNLLLVEIFANFSNFHWISKNNDRKYVSYFKIRKNKYQHFFFVEEQGFSMKKLNLDSSFFFLPHFYGEIHNSNVHVFCVIQLIFFPLEWSDPRNHCLKSAQIRSFFWSVFSCIRTEFRKIRTRKNYVFGHFSRSETVLRRMEFAK